MQEAQISLLISERVTIPKEYSGFANIFSEKLVAKLPKHICINDHAIKLKEGK